MGGRALPSQAAGFRGLLVSPFSSPGRRQGTEPGRGGPPSGEAELGRARLCSAPRGQLREDSFPSLVAPERRLQRRLWGWGVGSRASHLAGRGAGRERRGSGQHRGFGADMLKAGPGAGRGRGCGKPRTAWGGSRTGARPGLSPLPWEGHGGGWVPGVRRSGRGRVAQSLPSATASGGFSGGEEAVGILDVGEHTPPPPRPRLGGGGQAWLRAP